MNITYRRAKKEDIKEINLLFGEMIRTVNQFSDHPNKELENGYTDNYLDGYFVNEQRVIFVAEDQSKVVGFISVECYETYAYIDDFSVTEKYRNNGIGTKLLHLAEEYAKEKELHEIRLHVDENNKKAVSFYLKKFFYGSQITNKRICFKKLSD